MRYYFSGIGGIGMSSLALYKYYISGADNVCGSNNELNERVEYLQRKGIKVKLEQNHSLPNVDILVRSTAVKDNNPEILEAKKRNIKVLYRMQLLNEILKNHLSIGITGTDGKTTTTAMLSQIFKDAKKNPTVFLGGIHNSLEDGNFRFGNDLIIAEVDESDGFIKDTCTDYSIVTNLRPDHLEHYDNKFKNLEYSIFQFINNTRKLIFLCKDDPVLSSWNLTGKNVLYFGLNKDSDYILKNRVQNEKIQEFEVYKRDKLCGKITLKLPGLHYAYDALASCALALEFGIDFQNIKDSLYKYISVDRRFNIIFKNDDICIIDDYAHTPDEILATIKATKEYFPGKNIITIFQPHRFSRLYFHLNDFVEVLKNSDKVCVYRLYSAFEEPLNGVDERTIVELLNAQNIPARFYNTEEDIFFDLSKEQNSILLFVGAGDITNVARKFAKIKDNSLT